MDAILKLHLGWIIRAKVHAVIYVCGDQEACERIKKAGVRVGLYKSSRHLQIETLNTIKRQTTAAAYQQARTSTEPKAA